MGISWTLAVTYPMLTWFFIYVANPNIDPFMTMWFPDTFSCFLAKLDPNSSASIIDPKPPTIDNLDESRWCSLTLFSPEYVRMIVLLVECDWFLEKLRLSRSLSGLREAFLLKHDYFFEESREDEVGNLWRNSSYVFHDKGFFFFGLWVSRIFLPLLLGIHFGFDAPTLFLVV